MCVILEKPKGVTLTAEQIENAWYANPDGAGLLVSDGHTMTFQKGFMKLADLEKAVERLNVKSKDIYSVLHFRISTGGKVNEENTHPFCLEDSSMKEYTGRVGTRTFLFHNGIFSVSPTKVKSDTWILADMLKYVKGSNAKTHVIEPIRNSSRVLLTDGREKPLIKLGTWQDDGGVNASNLSYSWGRYSNYGNYSGFGYESWRKSYNSKKKTTEKKPLHFFLRDSDVSKQTDRLETLKGLETLVINRPQDFKDDEAISYALMVAEDDGNTEDISKKMNSINSNLKSTEEKRERMLEVIKKAIKEALFLKLTKKEQEILKLKEVKDVIDAAKPRKLYETWRELTEILKKYSPFVLLHESVVSFETTYENRLEFISAAADGRIEYLENHQHETEWQIDDSQEEIYIEILLEKINQIKHRHSKNTAALLYNSIFSIKDKELSSETLNKLTGFYTTSGKIELVKKMLEKRLNELSYVSSSIFEDQIVSSSFRDEKELTEELISNINGTMSYSQIDDLMQDAVSWISSDDTLSSIFEAMDGFMDEEDRVSAYSAILNIHLKELKRHEEKIEQKTQGSEENAEIKF